MPNIRTTSVAVMVDREVERNLRATTVALLVDRAVTRDIRVADTTAIIDADLARDIRVSDVCLIIDIDYNPGIWFDLLNQTDDFTYAHYAPEPSNGYSTLVNELTAEAMTFEVVDGSVFPANAPFDVNIGNEIMRVTRSGNILKARARPDAALHGAGSTVPAVLTAEGLYQKTVAVPPVPDLTGGTWGNQQTVTLDGRTFNGGSYYVNPTAYWYYLRTISSTTKVLVKFRLNLERYPVAPSSADLLFTMGWYDSNSSSAITAGLTAYQYPYNVQLTPVTYTGNTPSWGPSSYTAPTCDIYTYHFTRGPGTAVAYYINNLLIYESTKSTITHIIFGGSFPRTATLPWFIEILHYEES